MKTRATGLNFLAAAALWLAIATSAFAQKAATLPDPQRLAAAKELLSAQGGIDQARKGLDQTRAAMVAEVRRANPDEADGFASFMETYISNSNPKVSKLFEDVMEISALFYAERCTVEELKAMTAFLQTPAGKKLSSLAPEVTALLTPKLLDFQRGLMGDLQAAAQRGDFKKK